jgi:hypothetical protein
MPRPDHEGSHLARERRGCVDAVALEPALDLAARHAIGIAYQMNVVTEDRVPTANARVVIEAASELRIDPEVA